MRLCVVCLLWASLPAFAQSSSDEDAPPPSEKTEDKGNLNLTEKPAAEGSYKGVAPGAHALPPHPPRLPVKSGPQRMTWPGFQVKDGVPTVFLEVTAAPEYHITAAPGEVIITLMNTIVPLRNNRRSLDVTAFDTSVKEVVTQPKGKEVRVIIKTKGADRPPHHERVEDAAGGFRMLVIELPAK
jgi:hypothetical protein